MPVVGHLFSVYVKYLRNIFWGGKMAVVKNAYCCLLEALTLVTHGTRLTVPGAPAPLASVSICSCTHTHTQTCIYNVERKRNTCISCWWIAYFYLSGGFKKKKIDSLRKAGLGEDNIVSDFQVLKFIIQLLTWPCDLRSWLFRVLILYLGNVWRALQFTNYEPQYSRPVSDFRVSKPLPRGSLILSSSIFQKLKKSMYDCKFTHIWKLLCEILWLLLEKPPFLYQ